MFYHNIPLRNELKCQKEETKHELPQNQTCDHLKLIISNVVSFSHHPSVVLSVDPRTHKEGYPARLDPPPPPFEAQKNIFFNIVIFYFLSLLGGSFLGCAPGDGLLHTVALTKRVGKEANILRARDVKLHFRLFRYVYPCVNARWSM